MKATNMLESNTFNVPTFFCELFTTETFNKITHYDLFIYCCYLHRRFLNLIAKKFT